jgi:hypothetical protein
VLHHVLGRDGERADAGEEKRGLLSLPMHQIGALLTFPPWLRTIPGEMICILVTIVAFHLCHVPIAISAGVTPLVLLLPLALVLGVATVGARALLSLFATCIPDMSQMYL